MAGWRGSLPPTTKLHKAGSQYQACCPWHHDTNASLSIFEGREGDYRFKCFACSEYESDASGDVIAFVQRMEHVSFADAVSGLQVSAATEFVAYHEGSPNKFDYDRQKGTARLGEVKEYLAGRGCVRHCTRVRAGSSRLSKDRAGRRDAVR